MIEVSISAAARERLDDLRPLYFALYEHERKISPIPMTEPRERARRERRATYAQAFADGRALLLIAEDGDALVGYAFALLHEANDDTFELAPRYAELYSLAVAPGLRSGGIGTALVQALDANLSELDVTALIVAVTTTNHDALRFYQRLGLIPVETLLYRFTSAGDGCGSSSVRR